MFGRRQKLQRENALLRETLAWYATDANWKRPAGQPKRSHSAAVRDRGARAGFVLAQVANDLQRQAYERRVPVPAPLAEKE